MSLVACQLRRMRLLAMKTLLNVIGAFSIRLLSQYTVLNSPVQDYNHPNDHILPTQLWNDSWFQTFQKQFNVISRLRRLHLEKGKGLSIVGGRG